MKNKEEKLSKIFREYDFARTRAENKRDARVKELYAGCPQLKEIIDKINYVGLRNMRDVMANPENREELRRKFQEELKELDLEKKKILEENNIPSDYNIPDYECKLCNDTGFVGNEKCECFRRKMIDAEYADSNLSVVVRENTFDKVRFDYYSNRKIPGEEITYRENMEKIYSSAVIFCDEFEESTRRSLLMIGKTGLGKTFISNCIANEILKKGKSVSYVRATTMFTAYEDYKFKRDKEPSIDIEELYKCDLLIIDDLGSECTSKLGTSFLFDLINDRFDKGKKMIINSNLSINDITNTYSTRVTSRIYEGFKVLHFYGDDIRILKLKENMN